MTCWSCEWFMFVLILHLFLSLPLSLIFLLKEGDDSMDAFGCPKNMAVFMVWIWGAAVKHLPSHLLALFYLCRYIRPVYDMHSCCRLQPGLWKCMNRNFLPRPFGVFSHPACPYIYICHKHIYTYHPSNIYIVYIYMFFFFNPLFEVV